MFYLRKFKPYIQNGVESKWVEDFVPVMTPTTPIPKYLPGRADPNTPPPTGAPPATPGALPSPAPAIPTLPPPAAPNMVRKSSSASLGADGVPEKSPRSEKGSATCPIRFIPVQMLGDLLLKKPKQFSSLYIYFYVYLNLMPNSPRNVHLLQVQAIAVRGQAVGLILTSHWTIL